MLGYQTFLTVGSPHHSSFPHETLWWYSDADPSNGDVENAGRGRYETGSSPAAAERPRGASCHWIFR